MVTNILVHLGLAAILVFLFGLFIAAPVRASHQRRMARVRAMRPIDPAPAIRLLRERIEGEGK